MSYRIKLTSLTASNISDIRQHLIVKIKQKWVPATNKAVAARLNAAREDEIIIMFNIVDDMLHLPYAFACKLFNVRCNTNILHHKVSFDFVSSLRQNQQDIVPDMYNYLINHGTVMVAADTGTGKTVLTTYMTSLLKVLTLVIFSKELLTIQWARSYQTHTNAKIMYLYKSKCYYTYQYVCDQQFVLPDVIITIGSQLHKLAPELLSLVGCLVIDETHLMCTPSKVTQLLCTEPQYIIGCSATPTRTDEKHVMSYVMLGPNTVIMKNIKSVVVVKIMTTAEPAIELNKYGIPKWNVIVKSLYDNTGRDTLIKNIIMSNYGTHKMIVSASRVEYVLHLVEWLRYHGYKSDCLVRDKSTYEDHKDLVLVGIPAKMGAGFDEESLCQNFSGRRANMLILTNSMIEINSIIQLIGRVMRSDNPIVYDIVDNHTMFYKKHWNVRHAYYKSINAKVIVSNLNPAAQADSLTDAAAYARSILNISEHFEQTSLT